MNNADSMFCLAWTKKIRAINLLGGKCCKCNNDNIFVLEFHHPNDDKESNISSLRNKRWSLFEKEIKKCQLLCRNCHFEIHSFGTPRNIKLKRKLLKMKGVNECQKCGRSFLSVGSLVFHHLNEKKFEINTINVRRSHISWEDVIIEMDKCIVLCQNCHSMEHININKFNRLKKDIVFKVEHYKELSFPLDKRTVYDMYFNKNMTQADITRHFKCAKSTVCGLIKASDRQKEKKVFVDKLFICPICGKEFLSKYRDRIFCSKNCLSSSLKKNKPSKDQLQYDLNSLNQSQTGRKYSVSHTTIRKWAKSYGIIV